MNRKDKTKSVENSDNSRGIKVRWLDGPLGGRGVRPIHEPGGDDNLPGEHPATHTESPKLKTCMSCRKKVEQLTVCEDGRYVCIDCDRIITEDGMRRWYYNAQ